MQSYNLSNLNILILENNKLIRRLMSNVFHEFAARDMTYIANERRKLSEAA